MHPFKFDESNRDKPAYIMAGSGEIVTFRQLNDRSNQLAHAFRANGLNPGDTCAIFAENSPRYFEICWAARRSGLYFVCVSSRLTAPEVAYILKDSGAKLLISSASLGEISRDAAEEVGLNKCWSIDGTIEGYEALETVRDRYPTEPIADQMLGTDMLYSSGTTGRPKGLRAPFIPNVPVDEPNQLIAIVKALAGADDNSIYLSPAPLYHAAPLRFCMSYTMFGATLVIMEKFDPEKYLETVETYKVTQTQLVPTMLVRMLKLPEEVRSRYDLSSLKAAIHAAAPCPIPIKEQMIDWWGPIILEYYAGSEGNGLTWITSQDWMTHKGSVGRPVFGQLHICDDSGNELPPNEEGLIYFGGTVPPIYHNDEEKTLGAQHTKNKDWSTLGDVGKVDEDGFLYLTDRKAFMIISGGVNVYPQETENILITHPNVADCAVIGVPDEDLGEAVKAVVQPMDGIEPSDALAQELMKFCSANLSKIKCPKSVDFDLELPRHPTGKLYKRLVRDRYWGNKDSRIV